MREFPERFGDSERIDLETTFRCSGRVADVATRFVLANPAQIRKKVRSTCQLRGPCVYIGHSGGQDRSPLGNALDRITVDAARYVDGRGCCWAGTSTLAPPPCRVATDPQAALHADNSCNQELSEAAR